jgi:DNA repair exonuclease SbcCD nuclease subunit
MRILAFADLHYCTTWPFLRLEDFEEAAKRICQHARETRPQAVLFLGDRFRARQPKDHIRALADRQLRELADIQAGHGGEVVCLVGNHDRYSESVDSGNTYTTVSIFHDILPNVTVVREPGTYPFSQGAADWLFHALPTGYRYDAAKYVPDSDRINVFGFHGLVGGAYYDAKGAVRPGRGY